MISINGEQGTQTPREKPIGFQVMKITKAKAENSKAGNPCLSLELDIVEGKYTGYFKKFPLRYKQIISTEIGQRIVTNLIKYVAESNEGMVDPAIINAKELDESVLNGLLIGVEINTKKGLNQKDYCNVKDFCNVAMAREKNGTF